MSPGIIEVALAGLNVDRALREAIVGDLVEERTALAAERGARHADWWMLGQVVRSMPALARLTLRVAGPRALLRILGAALASLLAMLAIAGASASMAFDVLTPATMSRFALVVLAVDLAYAVAGGYLAARLGRVAPLASAIAVGVLAILLGIAGGDESIPAWYPVVLQCLLVPATTAGGWLRARQLAAGR